MGLHPPAPAQPAGPGPSGGRAGPLGGWLAGLLLALLALACASPGAEVRVARVIDGDTIVVQGDARVRYIGVDAPEAGERCGPQATALNRELVEGRQVRLVKDVSESDKYGRWLRYIWAGDTLVNAELVRRGYAQARSYPPDTRYDSLLARLQEEAWAGGRGMWAPGPCPSP